MLYIKAIDLNLKYSRCSNRFKIDLANLLWTLKNLGMVNSITITGALRAEAQLALDRMLSLSPLRKGEGYGQDH
jgi:quinolinate synthase